MCSSLRSVKLASSIWTHNNTCSACLATNVTKSNYSSLVTCNELRMVKMYWNTRPCLVTLKMPNAQVIPRRGERRAQAFAACRSFSALGALLLCIFRISWITRDSSTAFVWKKKNVTWLIITLGYNCTVNAEWDITSLLLAFQQKNVKLGWKKITRRPDSEQWEALNAFQLRSKQIFHLFTFLQCDLHRWYWEKRLLLLLLLLFFKTPSVLSFINAFISMPHQFAFSTPKRAQKKQPIFW